MLGGLPSSLQMKQTLAATLDELDVHEVGSAIEMVKYFNFR